MSETLKVAGSSACTPPKFTTRWPLTKTNRSSEEANWKLMASLV